ncbi:hypothetical protein ABPG74_003466 [Tetrahymena malaccensis]
MGSLPNEVIWLQKANLNETIQAFAFKNLVDSEIAESKRWLAYLCGIALFLDFLYFIWMIFQERSTQLSLAKHVRSILVAKVYLSQSHLVPILDLGGMEGWVFKKLNRSVFQNASGEKCSLRRFVQSFFFSSYALLWNNWIWKR